MYGGIDSKLKPGDKMEVAKCKFLIGQKFFGSKVDYPSEIDMPGFDRHFRGKVRQILSI